MRICYWISDVCSSDLFHGRSGARTGANAARLVAATGAPCYVLEGGIDAWRRAGLEVAADRRQPPDLMRQVQLDAGGLVLLGVALRFLVDRQSVGMGKDVAGLVDLSGRRTL